MFHNKLTRYQASFTLLLISMTASTQALAQDHISPAMVNIPAGSFIMGNHYGREKAKPAHQVAIAAFQMAKYPVTVSEFRKFAEDTGFNPSPSCSDYIGASWFNSPDDDSGTATWDKHRFQNNEYQPVTCITWQEANQYANWLSKKTGVSYRLPTEQEFEYALKANTTSRYFWGDDNNMSQACHYGNFADHSGEHIPNIEYGASYIGFLGHANCDDGEAYNSIVGLYRPNPFGLYDMVGNVSQYLSTCYYDGYQVRSEAEMDNTQCEFVAHRGGTWHFPPQPHADRSKTKRLDDTEWALLGFRLAADGHQSSIEKSTKVFEEKLKAAQEQRLATRVQLVQTPKMVQLTKLNNDQLELSWQANSNGQVTAYDVYLSNSNTAHLMAGFYQKHYHKLKTVSANTHSLTVDKPSNGGSFKVVAVAKEQTSLASKAALYMPTNHVSIPGRIEMQQVTSLEHVTLKHRKAAVDKPEMYYLARLHTGYEQPTITADFQINVKESAWYEVNYRGRTGKQGEFFKIWSNNKLAGSIKYDKNIADDTANRQKVFLEKGKQTLQLSIMREGRDYWHLVWLELNKIKQ